MISNIRRLRRNRRGNVAMLVALGAVPVIGGIGLAIDSGAALRREERLQAAVDSGVLAALRALPNQNDAGVRKAADRYIGTNMGGLPYALTEVEIDRSASKVRLEAVSRSQNMFGGLFGISHIDVRVEATAAGGGTIELVMALDNSGSMAEEGRIQALRTASTDLVDTLMGDAALANRIKIGVVPFSTAVNVGPGYSSASWIDSSNRGANHSENFNPSNRRFTVFGWTGQSWSGCVEARTTTGDLDVDDTAPSSGSAETLFIPMFAPDEPDTLLPGTNYNKYLNNYLNDYGGTCNNSAPNTDADRQSRTCKYKNQTPRTTHHQYGNKVGPNAKCESITLLPLTDQKSIVTAKLSAMKPEGNTNIIEGATWGWRVLSPTAPFTEGKPYDTTGNRKIMIVMTDGENTMSGTALNHNLSAYSAYGYAAKKRLLNPATSDETQIRNAMNERLRLACDNAKAEDVEIYSIIVSAPSDEARKVMEDCASPSGSVQHAFAISSASELGDVFEQIGKSIKQVRLAQ